MQTESQGSARQNHSKSSMSAGVTHARPPGPRIRKGILANLRYYAAFAVDPLGVVDGRFRQYGDLYWSESSGGALLVLKHPDHIREVLATRASSFTKEHTAFASLSRVLGSGLLTTDGDTWKRQRRMVQPAFAPSRLTAYAKVMVEESLRTATSWRAAGPREISDEMTSLTLRIVSRTLFGHDVPDADIRAIGDAMKSFQRSLARPDVLPAWLPTPGRRGLDRALATLDAIVYGLIEARRASRTVQARADLLDMLVSAADEDGGTLSVKEVRDHLVTLFLAGHETTSNALTWTWACLAENPECERALHAELDAVLDGRPPELADLERLPYTEQVISEAMRLYPPVYLIARRASEDTEVGGYPIPRGTEVVIWVYMAHRDPRFFPDPGAFRPERFTKERVAELPTHAYLPFGGGPRACIGKTFATMEARLILATLAQSHRVALASGQSLAVKPRITLTPKRGMRMVVFPRGGSVPA
jgi:cytochrome P450